MLKRILILLGATALGAVLLYPEIFVTHKVTFLSWGDYVIPYHCTYLLTTFFYQGGVQLWDFFGQMPHALLFNTFGVFQIPYALTAFVYWLGSFFALDSGKFFQEIFSVAYVGLLLVIQLLGIYLLLQRVTKNRWLQAIASSIYVFFFCTPTLVTGWFFQAYYPLLMYGFLSFAVTLQLRYLFIGLLLSAIFLSQSIVYSCYMYLTMHLFIVSCVAWAWFTHKGQWAFGGVKKFKSGLLWLGVMSFVLLAPYVYIQLFGLNNIEFGKSSSRLTHLWDIKYYFQNTDVFVKDYKQFFSHMLDITGNVGYILGYHFFGFMIFLCSAIAIIFSKDNKKWIFVSAIVLIWFINFPRNVFSVGLIGHVLTALTNPLAMVVRDFNVASLSHVPFLLVALAVMGVEVILNSLKHQTASDKSKWLWAFSLMGIFVALNFSSQPPATRVYLTWSMAIAFAGGSLVFLAQDKQWRLRGAVMLGMLFLCDAVFSWHQVKTQMADYSIRPRHVLSLDKPIWLDYQNPKIFPFVNRFNDFEVEADQNPYLWTLREASPSFTHDFNQQLMYIPPDGHNPRHVSYAQWWKDNLMRQYFKQNDQVIFFSRYGVANQPGVLQEIVGRGIAKDVIALEGKSANILPFIPAQIAPLPDFGDQWKVSAMGELKDFWDAFEYTDKFTVWDFRVNGSLPPHIATTALIKDQPIRFALQQKNGKMLEFEPVQGKLIEPLTFDMQNIKEGHVKVALPNDTSFTGAKGILLLKANPMFSLFSVQEHSNDHQAFRYNAPDNGWLGLHFPYDRKWVITVDGRKVNFLRMNKSFMAVPLTQGMHQISMKYDPFSWLRLGLFLSCVMAIFLFIGLIIYCLRLEGKNP